MGVKEEEAGADREGLCAEREGRGMTQGVRQNGPECQDVRRIIVLNQRIFFPLPLTPSPPLCECSEHISGQIKGGWVGAHGTFSSKLRVLHLCVLLRRGRIL